MSAALALPNDTACKVHLLQVMLVHLLVVSKFLLRMRAMLHLQGEPFLPLSQRSKVIQFSKHSPYLHRPEDTLILRLLDVFCHRLKCKHYLMVQHKARTHRRRRACLLHHQQVALVVQALTYELRRRQVLAGLEFQSVNK